jgi:hypothetical protein
LREAFWSDLVTICDLTQSNFAKRKLWQKNSQQEDHVTIHAAFFDDNTGSQQFVPARAGLPPLRPLYL